MFFVKSIDETIRIIQDNFSSYRTSEKEILVEDALHYVTATDIIAGEEVPHFNRSIVDGYAVDFKSIQLASTTTPAIVTIQGEVLMGEKSHFSGTKTSAIYVPTGGHLPPDTNCVVMIENTEKINDELFIYKSSSMWENVLLQGSDISKESLLVQKHTTITPLVIGALKSVGIKKIKVYEHLSATIISTGDEIVAAKDTLEIGEIRDINTYTIKETLKNHNIIIDKTVVIRDKFEEYKKTVLQAFETSDILFASGASSVGEKDYTIDVLKEIGADVLVHGLNIKPGKPTIIAKYENKYFIGLPGHPTSAYVVLSMLIDTILESIYKTAHKEEYYVEGTLESNVHNNSGRMFIQLVDYRDGKIHPLHYKSSMIHTLTVANGYIIIPATSEGIYQGERVKVYKLGD